MAHRDLEPSSMSSMVYSTMLTIWHMVAGVKLYGVGGPGEGGQGMCGILWWLWVVVMVAICTSSRLMCWYFVLMS